MSIQSRLIALKSALPDGVTLVAVSKTHPVETIREAYDAGQRVFGESRPQELAAKQAVLPADIEWHMIGHLQTNKIRAIIPFVSLIHSGDSPRLLESVDREAARAGRTVDVLLEVHVAQEDTKQGFSEDELFSYLRTGVYRNLKNLRFRGVMGIASLTEDEDRIRSEFSHLKTLSERLRGAFFDDSFDIVSMGMTSDWRIAVACGSNMVRIGSQIFGARETIQK